MSSAGSKRLVSLDIFRGITIAGMILVNDPGSWSYVYGPLRHAPWHGITPTDCVFPFFLFIVGVSISLAFRKHLTLGASTKELTHKTIKRAGTIFVLGLALWAVNGLVGGSFTLESMRIPGVLQRIALVYLACALLFMHTSWKSQARIAGLILLAYCLLLGLFPVPIDTTIQTALETGHVQAQAGMIPIGEIQSIGTDWIRANFEPGTNLAAWIDRNLIPWRLWEHSWDPEGLLSTLPAITTGILGMLAGTWIISASSPQRRVNGLMVSGFAALILGGIWGWYFPINKNLWTSSFVLFTSGFACLFLGGLMWIFDVEHLKSRFSIPFQVFGSNAITAYVLHNLCRFPFSFKFGQEGADWSLNSRFMEGLIVTGFSPPFVSLMWAILYTALIYLIVLQLHRRKIFIRL